MKLTWEDLEAHKGVVTPVQWSKITAYLRDRTPPSQIVSGGQSNSATRRAIGCGCVRLLKSLLGQTVIRAERPKALSSTVSPTRVRKSQRLLASRIRSPVDPKPIVASTGTSVDEPSGALALALRELFPRAECENASCRSGPETVMQASTSTGVD